MIINTDPDFDEVGLHAQTDPAARDRKVETACYGEPTTPEGSGLGFVLSLWLAFTFGCMIGAIVMSSRLSQ